MNPLLLQFANGRAFFVGIALVGMAVLGLRLWTTRPIVIAMRLAAVLGLLCVLLSATPQSIYLYLLWLCTTGVALLRHSESGHFPPALIAFCAVSGCMMGIELTYHFRPAVIGVGAQTVYVLGDSLSAGIGSSERPWPEVLAEHAGLDVKNLATPGATLASGFRQLEEIEEKEAVVVVELGGNDLLGSTAFAQFEKDLGRLLRVLKEDGHTVLMFELPLPPFYNRYGQAQRRVADRYGVMLIPKWCLARVLGMQKGTLDGLHLSQAGHHELARLMAPMLR